MILRLKSIMKQFPDINEIKLLEKNSQKNGSGILYEELLGIWKFKYVWGKESDEIKNIPSSILQVLFRPLLAFYFEKLKISISSFPVFNKELKKPEEKKMPFFSLVGISTKDNWLCARGRGGGLAIWVKS